METPICDFVREYAESDPVRMHMPGHKGKPLTGPEAFDLTEIGGADVLYRSEGIIRRSEENAAALFGTARTVYSAEGSSLCIRGMLYLALLSAKKKGIPARLLAGRNAHHTLMTAAALLDLDVDWLLPAPGEDLLSCAVSAEILDRALEQKQYMAVYLTSPDYLGRQVDLRAAAEVCHRHGVPLLVDNAHGAYLKFLPEDCHPITLGADACCDSAHKTLSCLTGAAYLHLSANAPEEWADQAEQAMSLFASTSPSWLILQSLDRMNRELAGDYPVRLRRMTEKLKELKKTLCEEGWTLAGDEPLKLTLCTADRGYTGEELHDMLRDHGIECEFADREYLVMMPSADTPEGDLERLLSALRGILQRKHIKEKPPELPVPEKVLSIREAMFSPRETLPVNLAVGRLLADACVSCPPAVPVIIAGERITDNEYSSEHVCIRVYHASDKTSYKGSIDYHVADIYLQDVTLLKTGSAGPDFTSPLTAKVGDMAQKYGAILAVSGDYCAVNNGIVIRNGITYFQQKPKRNICVLYRDGSMRTFTEDEYTVEALLSQDIWQVFNFYQIIFNDICKNFLLIGR